MNRREFLASTSAAAVATLAPIPSIAATIGAKVAPKSPVVAWMVGTPGEYNWQAIDAATLEEAIEAFAEENDLSNEDGTFSTHIEGRRCEAWDDMGDPSPGDWLRAGMGSACSRCGFESDPEMGAKAVGDEAVCEDCMTLADWWKIDPEYAAKLQAA